MFTNVEPGYQIPIQTQVTSMVKKCRMFGKKRLCEVLKKEVRFVVVTTDAWTSKAVKSFTAYTAHFIDGNWSLRSYVLATHRRHTAEDVKEHLCTVIRNFST